MCTTLKAFIAFVDFFARVLAFIAFTVLFTRVIAFIAFMLFFAHFIAVIAFMVVVARFIAFIATIAFVYTLASQNNGLGFRALHAEWSQWLEPKLLQMCVCAPLGVLAGIQAGGQVCAQVGVIGVLRVPWCT